MTVLVIGLLLSMLLRAGAHPHIWITMRSQIIYAADGTVREIRHSWTFDDLFSAYAVQGLPSKTPGVFTREELAALAEVNVTSMQEYRYFTIVKVNGKKTALNPPTDYWLDFDKGILTLNFTLPLKKSIKAQSLSIEIYDPVAFIDFTFEEENSVTLQGAPPLCKLNVARPKPLDNAQTRSLGEAFFNSLNPASNWGAQFVGRIAVQCP